ncbi:hypothetical protein KJ951_03190 [Patescibacteria group bacterium]|nr:hypothetical protein [Patescibacteria group bacterium]MBU1703384.1 hypothetical protein [Patescibacteria group bacterium]MBU1953821.1 hypothetical protein [Patescibacteria group bacterium]
MIIAEYLFQRYLEPGEKVVAVVHRHPFVLARAVLPLAALGLALPFFLWMLFPEYIFIFVIWGSITAVRIFREFMIWYHDAFLITDVSIIDVYWHGFFDRSSARLEYPMMEGVNLEIRGLRRVIFNYGTVSVQRGGGTNPLVLRDAMNPRKAERKIMSTVEEFMKNRSMRQSETLKELITEMVHHNYRENAKK